MTLEEIMQKMTELGTVEDASERRQIITDITDDIKTVYQQNETLTASNTKYEADNKKLQEYNMQLFLKVGSQSQSKKEVEEPNDETEELKYEDLFNEEGEII